MNGTVESRIRPAWTRAAGIALGVSAAIGGASRAAAQGPSDACLILCTPALAIEPTVTISNLLRRHRVQDLTSNSVAAVDREAKVELIIAVGVPTTIPRVGLTFEGVWAPFAGDNPVELEFELNLHLLESEATGGWLGAHFDMVDQFSPAKRPNAASAYTHKLDFELDVGVAPFNFLRAGQWLRHIEVEGSLDYLATGLPREGDVVPVGTQRFLDDASPWSLSLVLVIPVAPLRR